MISYRRVLPAEASVIAGHLKRLPSEGRQTRFFHFVSDDAIDDYVGKIRWRGAVMVGAFVGGAMRGVAEVIGDLSGAEFAVTVEPAWQHQGIGSELAKRALVAARNESISDVQIRYLRSNKPIGRIARRFGQTFHVGDDADELVSDVHLDAPTPHSLWSEAIDEALGRTNEMIDRAAAPAF